MDKFILYILIGIIIIIEELNSHTLFPGHKTHQELECLNVTMPSVDDCTKIKAENNQDACCLITYKNESSGEPISRCGFLENTEYGIKLYKHIFAGYKNIKILCNSKFRRNFILLSFILFLLII